MLNKLKWRNFSASLISLIFALQGGLLLAAPVTPRIKPPAPGPEYLSRLDHARLLTVQAALKKQQFSIAQAELKFVDDPTARSLGQWLYFMAKDKNVSPRAADAFLDDHPEWPATERIQVFVEGRIASTTRPAEILAFFDGREPISGNGKLHYARALLSRGENDIAERWLKDAWINHNFSVGTERSILRDYGARLNKADHAARVDRLLWARQVTNARRTFPHLSNRDRRMAEARAALLLRASTAPRLYRNLPVDEQLDSGVLYSAVRYYRRTEEEQYAMTLAAKAPDTTEALRNTDRWWTERRLLLQWALREGHFADAYGLAAQHGGVEGTDFSDAEFVAGWIALRFLGEPERALTHFEAMTGAVGTPISLSRGYYWLGRAAKAAGKDTDANNYYRAAAQHHYSFYGQLAAEALGGQDAARRFAEPSIVSPDDKARFNSRPGVAALRMLSDLNLDYEFMVFAYHLDDQLDRQGEYIELAKLTNGEGAPHLTVRAGKVATQRGAFTPHVAYPLIFVPDEARAFVRPEVILGLSRQESEFNPRAYSSAGARGVMQLIPSTAQITARKEGLPYRRSALLDDPVYNMTIGSAHLSHLIERFDGSLILTFAAYNAGAHRADRWIDEYGDPRTGDIDPLDWIELIPFSETRNYVQRVLENIQVYRGQLNNAPIPGQLALDIERGGAPGRVARSEAPPARLNALAQSRGGVGQLIDLPARTALLASSFRERANAAPVEAPQAPSISPTTEAKTTSPAQKPARSKRRVLKVKTTPAPGIPTPQSADPEPERPAATEPAPSAFSAPVESNTPSQTAPVATTPKRDPQPSAKAGSSPPASASTEPATVGEAEPPAPPPFSAAQDPVRTVYEIDPSSRETAAEIIENASDRLEIGAEADALAAAIARGLEQLEAEQAPREPATACVGADMIEDETARLNALMVAQLRGEDAPAPEGC